VVQLFDLSTFYLAQRADTETSVESAEIQQLNEHDAHFNMNGLGYIAIFDVQGKRKSSMTNSLTNFKVQTLLLPQLSRNSNANLLVSKLGRVHSNEILRQPFQTVEQVSPNQPVLFPVIFTESR
jgi:hypothetical protein